MAERAAARGAASNRQHTNSQHVAERDAMHIERIAALTLQLETSNAQLLEVCSVVDQMLRCLFQYLMSRTSTTSHGGRPNGHRICHPMPLAGIGKAPLARA